MSAWKFQPNTKIYLFTAKSNYEGKQYLAASHHARNSSVLIHSGRPGVLTPAQIQYFVQLVLPDTNTPVTFIAAWRYLPGNVKHDPFSTYPFLHAGLWSRELNTLGLYYPESIESHFAHFPIEWEEQ